MCCIDRLKWQYQPVIRSDYLDRPLLADSGHTNKNLVGHLLSVCFRPILLKNSFSYENKKAKAV
jgi:hypothetical protein